MDERIGRVEMDGWRGKGGLTFRYSGCEITEIILFQDSILTEKENVNQTLFCFVLLWCLSQRLNHFGEIISLLII